MKITIYTISDCPFSKQEKEYLTSHNLQFEEKNLETNKEFLTEMLTVSNNFAGTPVTKLKKDDGQIAVLKGFTPTEFDQALNLATATPAQTPEPVNPPVVEPPVPVDPGTPPPATDDVQKVVNELAAQGGDVPPTITPPVPDEPPMPPAPVPTEPSQPVVNLTADATTPSMPSLDNNPTPEPVAPPVVESPAPPAPAPRSEADQPVVETQPPVNDKLNSILANLQQRVNTSQTPPPTPFAGQPAAPSAPTIPDFH